MSSSSNVVIYQPKQLHNKFDPKERVYDGSASLEEMKTWLNENMYVVHVICIMLGHSLCSVIINLFISCRFTVSYYTIVTVLWGTFMMKFFCQCREFLQ